MNAAKPIVCVTGGSGFLGSHVCKALIDSGLYTVRATVRTKTPEKVEYLESIGVQVFGGCDLLKPKSFDEAIRGCAYLHHCASPFFFNTPTIGAEEGFVRPALDGTMNVLDSVKRVGENIQRIVLTSSCAAVTWANAKARGTNHVWSENDWQEDNTLENGPYRMSKRLAEQAAWKFVRTLDGVDLVTICPSFILGPILIKRTDAASVSFMKGLIDGSMKEVNASAFGCVDVRNVATAHVNAMHIDLAAQGLKNSHGQARFLLTSENSIPQLDIAKALKASGKFDNFPIPLQSAGPPLQFLNYSNERARKFLGVSFTDVSDSVTDGCSALLKHGLVVYGANRGNL
jgi:nucleoside-diphosphate-sugar epimerase